MILWKHPPLELTFLLRRPKMRLVILESPYAGEIEHNVKYARACVRDSLLRGEAPIASHLLYTQEGILDDKIPKERNLGIAAGLAWTDHADATVVYIDFSISPGMKFGIQNAEEHGRPVEYRFLYSVSINAEPER
jgi:hypothetical protein